MPKKIIQDIYTTNKKSIRMIKKSDTGTETVRSKKEKDTKVDLFKISSNKEDSFMEFDEEKVNKNSHFLLWLISIVSVVVLIYLVFSIFSTANIKITPKEEKIVLDDTYNIYKDSTDGLKYEIMTIDKELSKELTTDGEENVERKAVGKAVIYNNDSTSKQRLLINTRLETSDGVLYRIRESVDVPGYKIISGVKTPGSVETEIISDVAGEKYNMKLTDFKGDFKIPGFKNSTKYNTFYARLSTDVVGGLVGKVKIVSEDKIKSGREELKNNLKTELIKEIYSQIPEQYSFFKNNYYIQYSELPDSSLGDVYKINEKASVYVVIFNKEVLSSFITNKKIKDFDNSKVDILWGDNMVSNISGSTEKPWEENGLKIKLLGDASIVWQYDIKAILEKIKGKNKNILSTILDENKNSISEINAVIRPQWKNSFPENTKKIKASDSVRNTEII